ncbi:MAG: esterase/lipase family protein [Maricaulaceae bacterium]
MTHKYKHRAPSLISTSLEGRWVMEFAAHYLLKPLLRRLPKGDGHTVIVFPGFLTSETSTIPMRRLLNELGYDARDWGLGRNLQFNESVEQRMGAMVAAAAEETGERVSLVGWSLGGVFAREIARVMPEKVRCVISLGSPITGARHAALARPIFEFMNGKPEPETTKRIDKMYLAPPVPTTAVYSKTDGIVHWHGAIQEEGEQAENIRVPASHMGMGTNPLVMHILADRLSQAEGAWEPFSTDGLRKLAYRKPGVFNRPLAEFY